MPIEMCSGNVRLGKATQQRRVQVLMKGGAYSSGVFASARLR